MGRTKIFILLFVIIAMASSQELRSEPQILVSQAPPVFTSQPTPFQDKIPETQNKNQQAPTPAPTQAPFNFNFGFNDNNKNKQWNPQTSAAPQAPQTTQNANQPGTFTFTFGINPNNQGGADSTTNVAGNSGTNSNGINFSVNITDQNGNTTEATYQIPQELPEQLMVFFSTIYFGLLLCVLAFNCTLLYLCIKKRNQRNVIKTKMQQLQSLFAQSQNMNVFEMQAQANFPRTMHI